jgi:hypothetical protein
VVPGAIVAVRFGAGASFTLGAFGRFGAGIAMAL